MLAWAAAWSRGASESLAAAPQSSGSPRVAHLTNFTCSSVKKGPCPTKPDYFSSAQSCTLWANFTGPI
ncbi:hypothetical protein E2C01_047206 [Portunus trituberculatus]|uniref:Uncharacterized protein n=1 Tax=Portunus trituberculatus TaxID=210409 RepID=A0A5B7G6Y2_PORTR|nr:hypothetical protein [Portunus trituberculatus]